MNNRMKSKSHEPILEPDLDGTLSHIDILCYALSDDSSGSGVFVELHFERHQLVLSSPLPFLVLLLLSEGAFTRWST